MKNKSTIIRMSSPFIILFILMISFHTLMDTGFGDSQCMFRPVLAYTAHNHGIVDSYLIPILNYISKRYKTWSSRAVLEFFEVIFSYAPHIMWLIADCIIWTMGAFFMSKIFFKRTTFNSNAICCLFIFMYPLSDFCAAGWISATMCYSWGACFSTYLLYHWLHIAKGHHIGTISYIVCIILAIYSMNQEQLCFVLLVLLSCILLYTIYKNNLTQIIPLFPFAIINITELIVALICPGNKIRAARSIEHYFKDYASYNFCDKLKLGISTTASHLFNDWSFIIFAFICSISILTFATSKSHYDILRKLLSISSVLAYLINIYMHTGILIILYIGCTTIFCGLLLFYTRVDKLIFLISLATGFVSRIIMGFSPSIYESGNRTYTFTYFIVILNTLFIISRHQDVYKTWSSSKKLSRLSVAGCVAIILLIGVYQYVTIIYTQGLHT